jgi:hypothetical protein
LCRVADLARPGAGFDTVIHSSVWSDELVLFDKSASLLFHGIFVKIGPLRIGHSPMSLRPD